MRGRIAVALALSLALAACGDAASGQRATAHRAPTGARLVHWTRYVHIRTVLDLVGPRRGGAMIVAAAGKLWLLHRSGGVTPYAPQYASPGGEEAYIALAPRHGGGCSFPPGTIYALRLRPPRGVVAITAHGPVRQFAQISAPGLINGITFDTTGHFGHRLLVTVNDASLTTVEAIDCHGRVATITRLAPRVEGGLAVAPAGFGRFAGDLIAPDEISGKIFALTPRGTTHLLASSGLPHGQDVGVESAGFMPSGAVAALLADRLTPGNRHPGDDVVLRLGPAALHRAGVRAGDLLVATEGGAHVDAIRCRAHGCRVWHAADGPPEAHGEGHVAFAPAR